MVNAESVTAARCFGGVGGCTFTQSNLSRKKKNPGVVRSFIGDVYVYTIKCESENKKSVGKCSCQSQLSDALGGGARLHI